MGILTVDDYRTLTPIPADARLFYGPDPSQFADLFLPLGPGPHPVVALLHGGCWRAAFGLEQLGQMAAALTRRGLAVWSLEYRRIGNGGGWPNTFLDAAFAVEHLAAVKTRFNLDTERVMAVGHSAGGHLALWLAGRNRLTPADPLFAPATVSIRAVVSLAGIPDLAAAVERNICGTAAVELLGGPPTLVPERYAGTSPQNLLPLEIPHTHIVGTEDHVIPLDYLEEWADAARAVGDQVRLRVIHGVGHFEIVTAESAVWSLVEQEILAALPADV